MTVVRARVGVTVKLVDGLGLTLRLGLGSQLEEDIATNVLQDKCLSLGSSDIIKVFAGPLAMPPF